MGFLAIPRPIVGKRDGHLFLTWWLRLRDVGVGRALQASGKL